MKEKEIEKVLKNYFHIHQKKYGLNKFTEQYFYIFKN